MKHEAFAAPRPTVLVLTSTYPRWTDDPEPGFVHELARRLTGCFRVIVLGPHSPGSKAKEVLDGVEVIRYRYAPKRLETLVHNGGITTNIRRARWKWLLLPSFFLMQLVVAWKISRSERVSIIHAHWLIPQGLIAAVLHWATRRRLPFIVTSHGADLFALRGAGLLRLKRWVIRNASVATVVSQVMRERITAIDSSAAHIYVRPMGVDLRGRFVPAQSRVRTEDEILFVGRLVEKKGVRYLLDAMPRILARRPHARLRIVGFGPEEPALKNQVEELGISEWVQFLGAVSQNQLSDLYQCASVFVAPFVEAASGDQEGLGLVLVEAAGCECPIIAGDVPAVRDVLGKRVHGLIDPRKSGDLDAAIIRVLENPQQAREEAKILREELISRFDWSSVSDGYCDLLISHAMTY